jgi:hypothetical protein
VVSITAICSLPARRLSFSVMLAMRSCAVSTSPATIGAKYSNSCSPWTM